MRLFPDLHHRSNAAITIVGMTALCTSLAALLILFMNMALIKKELFSETHSFAKMLGVNLSVPLVFNDKAYANEILETLKLHPSIAHACVYKSDGQLFTQTTDTKSADCPAYAPAAGQPLDAAIQIPVFQNETRVGSVSVYHNSERVQNFREHIIWPSLGIIIGFTLLVAVPLSALVQRRISRPVNRLVANAQALIPNRQHDPNDMNMAFQMIELARKQLIELKEANKWGAYKVECITKNFQLSFALVNDQLQANHDIVVMNESLIQHSKFDTKEVAALFAVSRTEIERSQQYLTRLGNLLIYHERYVHSLPTQGRIEAVLREAYHDYFGKFYTNRISLSVHSVVDQGIKCFPEELMSFLFSYFQFCDLAATEETEATINFSSRHIDSNENKVLCSLDLDLSGSPITILPVENFYEDLVAHNMLSTVELEDKMKATVEKMLFFANLNTQHRPAMGMQFRPNGVLIEFYMDGQ